MSRRSGTLFGGGRAPFFEVGHPFLRGSNKKKSKFKLAGGRAHFLEEVGHPFLRLGTLFGARPHQGRGPTSIWRSAGTAGGILPGPDVKCLL